MAVPFPTHVPVSQQWEGLGDVVNGIARAFNSMRWIFMSETAPSRRDLLAKIWFELGHLRRRPPNRKTEPRE